MRIIFTMATLHPITDFSKADEIVNKGFLTKQDRYIMDSIVYPSLAKYCNDIRPNELDKVQEIEEENIVNFLFVTLGVFGQFNKKSFSEILSKEPYISYISEINKLKTEEERSRGFIRAIPKLLLANGKNSSNLKVGVVGKMPQKMFSFRQMTADEWYNNFVDYALLRISYVYEKLGIEDAIGSIGAICAYHLCNSQPEKYNSTIYHDDNEAIASILKMLIKNRMEYGAFVYDGSGELLSKSI